MCGKTCGDACGAYPFSFCFDILYVKEIEERKINPKRMQREVQSKIREPGIGTKAQQALKLQHEQCKLERKAKSREQKDAEKDRQFAIRQEKKKAKHRGR